ncbi:MAG: hypothetical protein ABIH23_30990 [bacterium]
MSIKDLIKSETDLLELAEAIAARLPKDEDAVARYRQIVFESMHTDHGRRNLNHCGLSATYNVENLSINTYSSVRGEELFPHTLDDFERWRERNEMPFVFTRKGFPLPESRSIRWTGPPSNHDCWDDELTDYTRKHPGDRITREFAVEQVVTVNSRGGLVIESKPFLGVFFRHGYDPLTVSRNVGAYVLSEDDVARFPILLAYLPDPTPDRRLQQAGSFWEAFDRLVRLSEVRHPDLQSVGFPDVLTHDVIMLNGVPAHEIFGHQFEEPVYPLPVGQRSLFPVGKNVQNPSLILKDNPHQTVEGYPVCGSYQFDAYGRPSSTKTHIRESVVCEHLGSEYVDLKNLQGFLGISKSDSVGNARQGDDGSFPQSRMSCTVLDGKVEEVDWSGKVVMVPHNGYVVDGSFFKVLACECYVLNGSGEPERVGPLEGSRAVYDAMMGMHLIDGKTHHIGTCSKPSVLESGVDTEVAVSFLVNNQLWEHLTIRPL